ncbi:MULTISPECIES: oxidoreductase [unclassified Pseudonocardia]|uniref:oxidoreductase n=1 Tax=unclassified Pseudonocardia TaxID=2619320 RepID=UPI0001FFF0F7|nr:MULTISPECIES: oxidoreductase [unclassified Pseudonocardia]ALE74645.1 short-chain dehydrogenase [Pseudonocardia sp. EC080625-04]ALL78074.1 short-chain dehydrogenase [Pseudonocardia sp. EC080610-09]ALL80985.1 short-chain dehydrogenase [Pseudonocardia sp. EC080619-01]OLM16975.1 putative oxidoreductase/Short-chain dehydrogenase [Pseudonocardia sp. Ae707_Ps1]
MFRNSPAPWTAADIPDQSGRTVVVTGANSGLGLETARALVDAGARVVLAVRDTAKGDAVAGELGGAATVRRLDLADLTSVREFAAGVEGPIDVLVNNAGLMAVPQSRTADGFETQLGVNFLGHFALTGLLADRITDRVVTLSSVMHRIGRIDLDDLNFRRRRYERWTAYGQSKLACLMFAYELEHRFVAAGSRLRSTAAHPGYSATNLQSRTESVQDAVMGVLNRIVAQPAAAGALPTLFAATVTDLPGGAYIGPDGIGEARGHPRPVGSTAASHDRRVQAALWERAEELTKVAFPV